MERKNRRKEKMMENKNRFKVHKLFLYASLNPFHLFPFIMQRLNTLKTHQFLTNFNYILFSFILSTVKPNEKTIFLTVFFFP